MILATRHRGDVQVRTTLADLGIPGPAQAAYAGQRVDSSTAAGVPAVDAAVRIAAEAVGCMCMGVWRGEGPDRRRITTTWQARLFDGPLNPQQTEMDFWTTVEESLSYRGNAYLWRLPSPDTGRVGEMWALHPDQVTPLVDDRGALVFRVAFTPGYPDPLGLGRRTIVQVGRDVILHVRGWGDGGRLVAPSPIERHRISIGAALAQQKYQERFYDQGTLSGIAISFPPTVNAQQAEQWRDLWGAQYEGVDQAHRTKVIGGGATVARIGLTQADAEYVDSANLSVEDIARIFRVTSSMLGVSRSDKPMSPEHEETRWFRQGLNPRLKRIEDALAADPFLFGPGARDRPRFDRADAVRPDLETEETIAHQQIQDGRLLVDEWRQMKGLPPLPGGVGSIPQIVPVGGAPNTAPAPPPDPAT